MNLSFLTGITLLVIYIILAKLFPNRAGLIFIITLVIIYTIAIVRAVPKSVSMSQTILFVAIGIIAFIISIFAVAFNIFYISGIKHVYANHDKHGSQRF